MKMTEVLAAVILASVLLPGADLSSYRKFRLGASLEGSLKQAGLPASDVLVVHRRPALIQQVEWDPSILARNAAEDRDPVKNHVLRFYNGQLFQVVSTYDRYKTEGMTEADLIHAISRTYGTATAPGGEIAYASNYGRTAAVIARWEDSTYSADLVRSADRVSFALILTAKQLEADARAAITESVLLDEIDAPLRAVREQSRQDEVHRIELDKARSANKPNFQP